MCGWLYGQVVEEAAADYLQRAAEPEETICEQYMKKKQVFVAGLQSKVVTFVPQRVSQAAACDGVIYSINNTNAAREPQGNLLPVFQD